MCGEVLMHNHHIDHITSRKLRRYVCCQVLLIKATSLFYYQQEVRAAPIKLKIHKFNTVANLPRSEHLSKIAPRSDQVMLRNGYKKKKTKPQELHLRLSRPQFTTVQ